MRLTGVDHLLPELPVIKVCKYFKILGLRRSNQNKIISNNIRTKTLYANSPDPYHLKDICDLQLVTEQRSEPQDHHSILTSIPFSPYNRERFGQPKTNYTLIPV